MKTEEKIKQLSDRIAKLLPIYRKAKQHLATVDSLLGNAMREKEILERSLIKVTYVKTKKEKAEKPKLTIGDIKNILLNMNKDDLKGIMKSLE